MATFLTCIKHWHSSATLYEAFVSLSNQYMHVVMHIHCVLTVFLYLLLMSFFILNNSLSCMYPLLLCLFKHLSSLPS